MKYIPKVGDNIEFQYHSEIWYIGTIVYINKNNICARLPKSYDYNVSGWPASEFQMDVKVNIPSDTLCWWISSCPMRLVKPTSYKELFLRKLSS